MRRPNSSSTRPSIASALVGGVMTIFSGTSACNQIPNPQSAHEANTTNTLQALGECPKTTITLQKSYDKGLESGAKMAEAYTILNTVRLQRYQVRPDLTETMATKPWYASPTDERCWNVSAHPTKPLDVKIKADIACTAALANFEKDQALNKPYQGSFDEASVLSIAGDCSDIVGEKNEDYFKRGFILGWEIGGIKASLKLELGDYDAQLPHPYNKKPTEDYRCHSRNFIHADYPKVSTTFPVTFKQIKYQQAINASEAYNPFEPTISHWASIFVDYNPITKLPQIQEVIIEGNTTLNCLRETTKQ